MYMAFVRREAVESAARTRDAMITGVWSNQSFDATEEDPNRRSNVLKEIESQFADVIDIIYGVKEPEKEADLKNDPFFAAMKVPELPDEFQAKDRKRIEELEKIYELSSTVDQAY